MEANVRKGYFYLLLTTFLWGTLYVVSKFVMGKLPTFTVAFSRYLIAFAALSLLAKKVGTQKIAKEDDKYVFIIGFLGYFAAVGMQLMGTKLAGSSVASLLNSMNPITISLMAWLILKEKMTMPKVAGLALSLFGVYLIIGTGADINLAGALASGVAVLGWSYMSVITRKVTSKYDALTITRAAMGITVVCDLPVCIGEILLTDQQVIFDAASVLGLLYIGLVCTALTMILWNKSLSMLPASICSAFYPIQTLTSSMLGVLILHETAGLSFWSGSACIIIGVLISLLWKSRQKES